MKKLVPCLVSALALSGLVAPSMHAAPIADGQQYTVVNVGTLPKKNKSVATALNNAGVVAGNSLDSPENEAAFRFDSKSGEIEQLATATKAFTNVTHALGINEAGIIVGDSTFSAGRRSGESSQQAAIFQDGSLATLGVLRRGDRFSSAFDINNAHMVVGFSSPNVDGQKSAAFAWSKAAGMFDIGNLGGEDAQALAINDAGLVTGYSETAVTGKTGSTETHAFLAEVADSGKVSSLIDLGTLGGSHSYGTGISEKGHVVGYSTLNPNGNFHAFLYENGKMADLGSLDRSGSKSDQSFALGVNSTGHAVGYAFLPLEAGAQQVGFIFRAGAMQDLNNLIGDAAKRYLIYMANAINDEGQIAATAFDRETNAFRAVLLSPNAKVMRE